MNPIAVINTSKSTSTDFIKNNSIQNSVFNETTDMSDTEHVVWACLLAIINIASLLGNSLVIFVVFKNKQFRNRKFAFLLLLIVSDFVIATVLMPWYLVNLLVETFFETSDLTCFLTAVIFTITTTFSYLCISTLTLERYIMVKYPIKHRRWFTKSVATGIIVAVIILSTIATVAEILRSTSVTYNKKFRVCFFDLQGRTEQETHKNVTGKLVSVGTFCFVQIYSSLRVIVIIWKGKKSTQINPEVQNSTTVTNQCVINTQTREISSTVRILSITFVTLCCCLPSSIGYACYLLGYHWSERSLVATIVIFCCKSAINPFINAFLHTQMREDLVKVLCCKFQS